MSTPTRLLADALIPGGVDAFIAERRARNVSWRKIAKELDRATDGKVDVAPETLRLWSATRSSEAA